MIKSCVNRVWGFVEVNGSLLRCQILLLQKKFFTFEFREFFSNIFKMARLYDKNCPKINAAPTKTKMPAGEIKQTTKIGAHFKNFAQMPKWTGRLSELRKRGDFFLIHSAFLRRPDRTLPADQEYGKIRFFFRYLSTNGIVSAQKFKRVTNCIVVSQPSQLLTETQLCKNSCYREDATDMFQVMPTFYPRYQEKSLFNFIDHYETFVLTLLNRTAS